MKCIQQSLGAQLLQVQWQDSDIPLFYLSPMTLGDVPRRGGVPILFPQFADRGALTKHGLARNLSWQCLENERVNSELHRSHYRLVIHHALLPEWPYAASLDLFVNCQHNQLEVRLQICNTGTQAFDWTGGLHPYFYVDDILQTQIMGLHHVPCEDRYAQNQQVPTQGQECLHFDGEPIERLYQLAPTLELVQSRRRLERIEMSCTGFSQWMIWNPGQAGEVHFADLPPGDWRHFICIEPVIALQSQRLEPGQCFEGALYIRAKNE